MKLSNYKTSNPAFTGFFWDGGSDSSKKMSINGILIKSLACILLIAIITAYVWKLYNDGVDVKWFTLGGMLGSIVISIVISIKHHWSHFLLQILVLPRPDHPYKHPWPPTFVSRIGKFDLLLARS